MGYLQGDLLHTIVTFRMSLADTLFSPELRALSEASRINLEGFVSITFNNVHKGSGCSLLYEDCVIEEYLRPTRS